MTAAEKAALGAGLYGAALPLLQNTKANIEADINPLVDAIMAYGTGKDLLAARRDTLDTKVDTGRNFLILGRDTFKPTLGSEYNERWDITGLVGTLMIPRWADDLVPLLRSYKLFLAGNPDMEVPNKNISATHADELLTQLKAAMGAVNEQEGILDNLLTERDAKAGNLRKRMSDLIAELKMRLSGLDGRWKAFGLNPPDALETPDQVLNVVATLIGPTAVALKWQASPRAEYYHVFKKTHGLDDDYVLVGSPADLDFTLENLSAGTEVEIVVTAVNNGGESPISPKVIITTH